MNLIVRYVKWFQRRVRYRPTYMLTRNEDGAFRCHVELHDFHMQCKACMDEDIAMMLDISSNDYRAIITDNGKASYSRYIDTTYFYTVPDAERACARIQSFIDNGKWGDIS